MYVFVKGKKCEHCPVRNVYKTASDKDYITYECESCHQVWKELREERAVENLITAIEKKGIKKHTR